MWNWKLKDRKEFFKNIKYFLKWQHQQNSELGVQHSVPPSKKRPTITNEQLYTDVNDSGSTLGYNEEATEIPSSKLRISSEKNIGGILHCISPSLSPS